MLDFPAKVKARRAVWARGRVAGGGELVRTAGREYS